MIRPWVSNNFKAVRRMFQMLFRTLLLAGGVAVVVWGWREFCAPLPPQQPFDEDAVRMCAPTIGEILEIGPTSKKLGYLVATVVGLVMTGGSLLPVFRKETAA